MWAVLGGWLWAADAVALGPSEPITPPEVLSRVPAAYPQDERGRTEALAVTLRVTVGADGSVQDVVVVESAGQSFDSAAVAAVEQWKFAPARRGQTAIASRIRVAIRFAPPDVEPVAGGRTPPPPAAVEFPAQSQPAPVTPAPGPAPAPTEPAAAIDEPVEVTVRGDRPTRATDRGASHFDVDRDILEAAPRSEGAEILRAAPGVYIGRAEGAAVAHRYVLRGFDADHGQDIEMRVAGLPINLPSHIHGQGYSDLGFLIPEAVDSIGVTEGVADPRQGDFAVAGSFDIRLAVPQRGWLIKSGYGRFNRYRQLVLWAPKGQDEQTFSAVAFDRTDGFGDNRRGRAVSAIVQARLGKGAWRHRIATFGHGARSELAGVVRVDDVDAGAVDYYGVYPLPTAQQQNALAARFMAGYFPEYRGSKRDNADLGVWVGYDNFRLQENFTGFTQVSRTLDGVAGRGDLIEQQNRTAQVGLTARYRTRPYRPARWAKGTLELGLSGRFDNIEQAQNLLDAAVRNQTWDRRVDAEIRAGDIGMWGDLDWSFTQYLRLRLGMRANVLFYDVDDKLGNFAPVSRPDDTFIEGFRRSAMGVAVGPRTSAEVNPLEWLTLRAAYGEGYRSPQARTLEDGEEAPFSKVRSGDAGVRFGRDERAQLHVSGFVTQLSDDVAFDARQGRLERIGETLRLGTVVYGQTRPTDWFIGALSVTYVDAELREPPPPTAEQPQPPFERGQNLPFVPPVVVRLDTGAHTTLARRARPWPLTGRIGLGFSYMSPRPLPVGGFSDHVPLLDVSAGLGFGPIDLGASFFNILDYRYPAIEFNFPSYWDPGAPRSRIPERHIAAGPPFSFLITLGVRL